MGDSARKYTAREEYLGAWLHIAGCAGFLFCGYLLFAGVDFVRDRVFGAALVFYFLTLLFMFGASSLYHLQKEPARKRLAQKFDHCAIYFLITGTYAPLMMGIVPDWRGYSVLAGLAVLTVAGVVIKFTGTGKYHKLEVVLYLLMGWMCVTVMKPMLEIFNPSGLHLLFYGGVTYTAGVIFYAVKREFFHAAWHIFVLGGAALQFAAVISLKNQLC